MRTIFEKILFSALAVVCLSACERSSEHEDIVSDATSVLQIYTRSGDANDATVSYPVQVYVFKDGQCVAMQTIEDEDGALSLPLPEGDYSVYAIGGVSEDDYVLPSQETATVASVVALREGKIHGDLMAATTNVTLEEAGTNHVTLTMERLTVLLESVTMSQIPLDATAVEVTISPLWENLTLGVAFMGESGKETVALTKLDDEGTWKFEGTKYLLPPSSDEISIMVSITRSESTSKYAYTSTESFSPGYRMNIVGTYAESAATLTGTITGAQWEGEQTMTFQFKESNRVTDEEEEDNGDDEEEEEDVTIFTETALPTVGSTYKTCFVLSVNKDVTPAEVVLLSPHEEKVGGTTSDEKWTGLDAALESCAVTGIQGWRLMTATEIKSLRTYRTQLSMGDSKHYLYLYEGSTIKSCTIGTYKTTDIPLSANDILRPVATVKINIE